MKQKMACVETRSRGRKCLGRVDYFESADLPHGVLPTKKAVIEVMLYLLRPRRAGQSQRSRSDAADMLASVLQEHWIFCNLYTISTKNIKKHIIKLYEDFLKLLQTRDSRKNESYDAKVLAFNKDSVAMFDIFCTDACQRRKFENFYDVRMTENEWKFLEDQRGERKMYCQDHVDTQWTKTMTRRNNDLFALERMRHSVNAEQPMAVPESTETTEDTSDSADELYTPVTVEDVEFQSPRKKKKVMEDKNSNASSSMPEEYQHVRCSMRKVRPEYYEVVDKLKSCFHMSQNQAEAAVVETANKMFGRNWKYHDEEAEIDVDTLPDKKNARRVGKCIETMALSEIVTEVVSSDDQSTITYANDGSKKQGAGSFTVQGIIINGKY